MTKSTRQIITYAAVAVLIAAAVVFGAIISKDNQVAQGSQTASPKASKTPKPTSIPYVSVTVTGEVNAPGKYKLQEGSVMQDLIEAAGGFGEYAQTDSVILDARLVDGQKIHISIDVEKIP